MARLIFFVLTVLFAGHASGAEDLISTERGNFSLLLLAGYQDSRLLNSDGSYASYKGFLGGAGLDVQIWGNGNSSVRLFGRYFAGEGDGDPSSNKMKTAQTIWGAKVFANPWFYISGGYGNLTAKVSSASSESSLSAAVTTVGLGGEWHVSGNWYWSLGAHYRTGPIKKEDNPNFSGNSNFDGFNGILGLIWSPSSTTVQVSRPR